MFPFSFLFGIHQLSVDLNTIPKSEISINIPVLDVTADIISDMSLNLKR